MIITKSTVTALRRVATVSKGAPVTVSGGKARTFSNIHSFEIDIGQDIGEFSIHGDKLESALSSFEGSDEIRLSVTDNNLTFSNPTTKRRMPALIAENSPKLDVKQPIWSYTFKNIQEVLSAIKKSRSLSGDEKTGRDVVFLRIKSGKLTVFATNGVTFYLELVGDCAAQDKTIKLKPEHIAILNGTVGSDVKALIAVDAADKIIVKTTSAISIMAGYTEPTPDYLSIIDSRFAVRSDLSIATDVLEICVDVIKLRDSAKRCTKVFSAEESEYERPIRLLGEGSKMELYAISLKTADSINDTISYRGDRYEIVFYASNLIAALSAADPSSKMYIHRGISQSGQPLCIRSERVCVYVGPKERDA